MVSSRVFHKNDEASVVDFEFTVGPFALTSYMVALVTFLAILLLMHILRFVKIIGPLSSVMRYANRDMKHFFFVFTITSLSFVIIFYLLFFDNTTAYSTMITSVETSIIRQLCKDDEEQEYEKIIAESNGDV
ncbi:Polycystic kidney disease protein 1-like 2 [Taenia solium]|eukprot:TsM_000945700 transcript=TsM_000945700 gene=TsM_000945700